MIDSQANEISLNMKSALLVLDRFPAVRPRLPGLGRQRGRSTEADPRGSYHRPHGRGVGVAAGTGYASDRLPPHPTVALIKSEIRIRLHF
jgi:hypothetical protein